MTDAQFTAIMTELQQFNAAIARLAPMSDENEQWFKELKKHQAKWIEEFNAKVGRT